MPPSNFQIQYSYFLTSTKKGKQRTLKGTWKCTLYGQLLYIYRLKLYPLRTVALYIQAQIVPFTDSCSIYTGSQLLYIYRLKLYPLRTVALYIQAQIVPFTDSCSIYTGSNCTLYGQLLYIYRLKLYPLRTVALYIQAQIIPFTDSCSIYIQAQIVHFTDSCSIYIQAQIRGTIHYMEKMKLPFIDNDLLYICNHDVW